MPPASAYDSLDVDQGAFNYYASLRNPDGSLYQSLCDFPKSSGLSVTSASTHASLNEHQDIYNPHTSKGEDQSLYDVCSDFEIPGLQQKKVAPDSGSDYEITPNTIPV